MLNLNRLKLHPCSRLYFITIIYLQSFYKQRNDILLYTSVSCAHLTRSSTRCSTTFTTPSKDTREDECQNIENIHNNRQYPCIKSMLALGTEVISLNVPVVSSYPSIKELAVWIAMTVTIVLTMNKRTSVTSVAVAIFFTCGFKL